MNSPHRRSVLWAPIGGAEIVQLAEHLMHRHKLHLEIGPFSALF